jgi:hypothetical protein
MRLSSLALIGTGLGLASGSAAAYWELIPQLGAGITWESNPRYVSDSLKEDVSGTYAQVGLDGSYKTPADQVSLAATLTQTNYLDSNGVSNESLNNDNWSVNLGANHDDRRGGIGLFGGYAESPIRNGTEDPNAPPQPSGGGNFSDGTQKNGNLGASLSYNLSPRNRAALSFSTGKVTYDVPGDRQLNRGYFNYTNDSASVAMSHYLNEKNFFQLVLNGGTFNSEAQNGPARNTTDSYGINVGYTYVPTETVLASLNVGTARTSVDIRGLPFDPLTGALCPEVAPCSASDESRNFVGNISVSKRSEETNLTLDVSRALTPQSNGTQDITDTFSLYGQRTLTKRLSTSAGALFSNSSAVGDLGRQNQKYSNLNFSLSWQLTATLSTYGKYSYVSSEDDGQSNPDTDNILFFGVSYQGVGFRR